MKKYGDKTEDTEAVVKSLLTATYATIFRLKSMIKVRVYNS